MIDDTILNAFVEGVATPKEGAQILSEAAFDLQFSEMVDTIREIGSSCTMDELRISFYATISHVEIRIPRAASKKK